MMGSLDDWSADKAVRAPFRPSGFGFLSALEFRISDFRFISRGKLPVSRRRFPFLSLETFSKTNAMDSDQTCPYYKIWGVDGIIYGPVELPTLVHWVKDERVAANTWLYCDHNESWFRAGDLQELQMFFRAKPTPGATAPDHSANLKPGALRRVKILADMKDAQLERFAQFMEVITVRQWTEVVKQGETGDAMYLILEGELRVRLMINGKETILTQLGAGEFFGEMALFDHGPRSADVVANKDSLLLKISAASFDKLFTLAPELAAPFLLSTSKTLAARIRADNKRFKDSVSFARTGGF